MNKLFGLALLTLSLSTMAKLPDPLWTPQGGNYQQQFGGPVSHLKPAQHNCTMGTEKHATSDHGNAPSGNSSLSSAHHLL